jgi:hypothetical protein
LEGRTEIGMNVRVQRDPERGLRVHRFFGRITFHDLLATMAEGGVAEPDRSGRNALWDFTQAFPAVSPEELERLADLAGQLPGGAACPQAAIVAADDLAFGLARVYSGRVNSKSAGEVRIFRTREEALQWVASPPSDRSANDD